MGLETPFSETITPPFRDDAFPFLPPVVQISTAQQHHRRLHGANHRLLVVADLLKRNPSVL